MWHVTCDIWHMTCGGGEASIQILAPYLILFGSKGVLKIFSQRMTMLPNERMNEWQRCLSKSCGYTVCLRYGHCDKNMAGCRKNLYSSLLWQSWLCTIFLQKKIENWAYEAMTKKGLISMIFWKKISFEGDFCNNFFLSFSDTQDSILKFKNFLHFGLVVLVIPKLKCLVKLNRTIPVWYTWKRKNQTSS